MNWTCGRECKCFSVLVRSPLKGKPRLWRCLETSWWQSKQKLRRSSLPVSLAANCVRSPVSCCRGVFSRSRETNDFLSFIKYYEWISQPSRGAERSTDRRRGRVFLLQVSREGQNWEDSSARVYRLWESVSLEIKIQTGLLPRSAETQLSHGCFLTAVCLYLLLIPTVSVCPWSSMLLQKKTKKTGGFFCCSDLVHHQSIHVLHLCRSDSTGPLTSFFSVTSSPWKGVLM